MRTEKKLMMLAGVGLVVSMVLFTVSFAQADWTRGYYRSNGTYVQPYQRTHPDGNPYNNYSFPGNYNPNTHRTTPGNPNSYLDRYYNGSNNGSFHSPYRYRLK